MDGRSTPDAARLLMLLAEFGHTVGSAMASVAPDPELVANTPLLVLSHIQLRGPQRPHDLAAVTGMTTGGLSKLLDRMEGFGVVVRRRGALPGDRRAVIVTITERGTELMALVTRELAARLPETRALVREIVALVEPSD